MRNMLKTAIYSITCVIILIAGSAQSETISKNRSTESPNGIWIVQLEDAPTVRFEGDVIQSVTADGRSGRKVLEATAPAVTGTKKLDIAAPAVQRYMSYLDDARAQVLSQAEQSMGRDMQPRHVYRHVLNGFAVEMSEAEARQMAQMPGVKSVEPDVIQYTQMDAGRPWIGTDRYWSGAGGVPAPNRGEGMVLGVVDTGINWDSFLLDNSRPGVTSVTNPRPGFLGLCSDPEIPCSGKLIGVYDFTDEGTKGNDPDGHGTHVATTAVGFPVEGNIGFYAGPDVRYSLSGIAPQASLISYKACEADPDPEENRFSCPRSMTTAALDQAIEDQVDAVNFSIGGPAFDPWLAQFSNGARTTTSVFLNVRAAGIVPVVAAGNLSSAVTSVASPANSPWVLAVANATHNRKLVSRLQNTSGGDFVLGNIDGAGTTTGTGVLPIVHAKDFGNALCGVGPAESGQICEDFTGASNPFPAGTFSGQIVVCDRGGYARIEKGRNVQLAGAAGMILANTQEQGENLENERHCLPTTQVNASDGDRLRGWLDSGTGHSGRLGSAIRGVSDRFGGLLNDSSLRGPAIGAPNVMKPNLTAPGTDVVAAIHEVDGNPDLVGLLTGTSMASPHVAGAALLLRKSHPDWGVDEVISALETTADAGIVTQGDGSTARIIDRGAGGVQVDRAARIGLYLPTTINEFRNANPGLGGVPGDLNLPGMMSENCGSECTFTRRVRALGNGTWTVTTEGDMDIEATPASFTLTEGQEQTITVTIRPPEAQIGNWGSGFVVLSSSNPQYVTQRLPVGSAASGFTSENNRGRGMVRADDIKALPEAIYRTSALVRPEQRSPALTQDRSSSGPYGGGPGVFEETFSVPPNAFFLYAETFASTSRDVDLFIGRDLNGNNRADEDEEICASITADDLEECRIERPEAGTWWIVVQNFASSTLSASDTVPFEFAVLSESNDPSLVVSGTANHPGGDLELPVYWDQPAMLQNERWLGAIGIASSPDHVADGGIAFISVTRTGENAPQITPLFEGETQTVVIPPNTTHDGIFIDVPATATSFEATISGNLSNVRAFLFPLGEIDGPALALSDLEPLPMINIPPGPGNPDITIQEQENGWQVNISPVSGVDFLPSARYFLALENNALSEVSASLTANVEQQGRLVPQRGLWNPRDRGEISQGFQLQVGPPDNTFVLWYSYAEDGSSTFYISDAFPPESDSSYFQALLYRVTSNGIRQSADPVGRVQVTTLGEGTETGLVSYTWQLNGYHGAELFVPGHGSVCPIIDGQPTQLLGHWFPVDVAEGGSTVLVTDRTEAWIRFYFDDSGQPRWVLADGELVTTLSTSATLELLDFRSFCIYCEETEAVNQSVGTLERTFQDTMNMVELIDFEVGAPISTNYSRERAFQRLSTPQTCPN